MLETRGSIVTRGARTLLLCVATTTAGFSGGACSNGEPDGEAETLPVEDAMSGGQGTVFDQTRDAFNKPLGNLEGDRRDDFFLGNAIFNRGWVAAPASVADFDGLGPFFNATNCSGCHFKDGRGRPPEPGAAPGSGKGSFLSILLRLSIPGAGPHGEPVPDPVYGDQLQGSAILGVKREGVEHVTTEEVPGSYADGTPYALQRPTYSIDELGYGPLHPDVMISPRVAPALPGLGLLEAIPEVSLLALADESDRDGDGISGRPNHVWDQTLGAVVVGRFGWKANQPSIHQQDAGAFLGDMGITSTLFPNETCSASQASCVGSPTGPGPQLRDDLLAQVDFYGRTLAVPGRRDVDSLNVRRGRRSFDAAGCASCHRATFVTGEVTGFPELSRQTIHPFSDLLLHDMGAELADGRPDFEATGTEWRTPPLWGIGMVKTVNGHTRFLHDGRARGFAEAILWHGGEANRSREAFRAMSKAERDDLVAFLESL